MIILARLDSLAAQHIIDFITPDVIIASEFLEHLSDQDIINYLKQVRNTLRPGGYFLVTVPNGFGCFEIESFFWNKFKLGGIIMASGIEKIISKEKPDFRIYFFGDSFTFGERVNNEDTFTNIIKEKYLKKMELLQDEKVVFIFDECHRSQF